MKLSIYVVKTHEINKISKITGKTVPYLPLTIEEVVRLSVLVTKSVKRQEFSKITGNFTTCLPLTYERKIYFIKKGGKKNGNGKRIKEK